MYEFACTEPITVAGRLAAGAMEVVAENRDTATVEVVPFDGSDTSRDGAERTRVDLEGGRLLVEAPEMGLGWLLRRGPRLRVTIRVPLDSALELKVASADVRCQGRFGQCVLNSASGDLHLAQSGADVSVHSASGDVRIDDVAGTLTADTASGDLRIGRVGADTGVRTASGDVSVGVAGGSVQVTTASGDVRIDSAQRGQVTVRTASGDVSVGVVRGTGLWLDLSTVSGSTRNGLSMAGEAPDGTPAGAGEVDLNLSVRTVSGDIDLHRAAAPAAARTDA